MEYRQLGRSGLRISALTLGTMTFGGAGAFKHVGTTDRTGARRIVDQSLDAGVNLVDTADGYSDGLSEEILGEAIKGRRERLLVATKARFPTGDGPNDEGLSRHHLIGACEASLRRLGIDHIDLYQTHEWDGATPLEETAEALDTLVRQGKVRYLGCSNFSGWHLMKALATADRLGAQRYVCPADQLHAAGARGRVRAHPRGHRPGRRRARLEPARRRPALRQVPERRRPVRGTRARTRAGTAIPIGDWPALWRIVDALADIAAARGVSAAQVALAWLLARPGVTSLDHRRARRGAARRQPRRGRARAERRGARTARAGQPAAAALSLLAPGRAASPTA